jgi:hypothetical protein
VDATLGAIRHKIDLLKGTAILFTLYAVPLALQPALTQLLAQMR